MKRIVVQSPTSSIKTVQSAFLAKCVKVSDTTVSRRLTSFRIKIAKTHKKPFLTKSMKTKRLTFAKAHRHWTTEHWRKVLFSDESTIQQFAARKQNVCRSKRKIDNERYTISTKKPISNDLGIMPCNGSADLYFLPLVGP